MEEKLFCQKMQLVTVKNQNLSKSKKLASGLLSSLGITTPLS